jgi:arylsulfatase A-like enzyme
MQNVPQRGIDGSYYDERAVRTERWKLILRKFDVRPEVRPGELYDLNADPDENTNLFASNRATVRELAAELQRWGEEHQDFLAIELGRHSW